MRAREAIVAASLALALAGCSRGWRVSGTLLDASGTPLSAAVVSFRCGPRSSPTGPMFTMKSDALGHFSASGESQANDPGPACSLEIVAAGHATKTIAVTDVCYRSAAGGSLGKECAPDDGKIIVP